MKLKYIQFFNDRGSSRGCFIYYINESLKNIINHKIAFSLKNYISYLNFRKHLNSSYNTREIYCK